MSRQEIIEKLCLVINTSRSQDDKNLANKTLSNILSKKISEEEASDIVNKLIGLPYWRSVNLPKNLYDNLKKYKKDELSDIQKVKLVSSIITRCLIEIEHNPDLTAEIVGLYDFLDYLNFSLLDADKYNKSKHSLLFLLNKYGFIIESEEES